MPLEPAPKNLGDKLLAFWREKKDRKLAELQEKNKIPITEDDFNFQCLWEDEPAGNIWKYVPAISIILEIILVILIASKK